MTPSPWPVSFFPFLSLFFSYFPTLVFPCLPSANSRTFPREQSGCIGLRLSWTDGGRLDAKDPWCWMGGLRHDAGRRTLMIHRAM
ncbi:hypothetical protein HDV57DRAFT_486313 [Trichoderma longibrachiatum]